MTNLNSKVREATIKKAKKFTTVVSYLQKFQPLSELENRCFFVKLYLSLLSFSFFISKRYIITLPHHTTPSQKTF